MLSKLTPAILVSGGSVILVGALIGSLYYISRPDYSGGDVPDPLEIQCAAALLTTVQGIAREYEVEYGQKVFIDSGPSQVLLNHLKEKKKADLFLPADDSFVRLAEKDKLVDHVVNVATMTPVVIVKPGLKREIKKWDDVVASGSNIALANPDVAAIGKLVKRELQGRGLWDGLAAAKPTYLGDVNEVGNSVAKIGTSDVGITWDTLATQLEKSNPGLKIVKLKELSGANARIQIAVVATTTQRDRAKRFIAYLLAKGKGARHLKNAGYADVNESEEMGEKRELTIYAGAMLRPALEDSLKEFENREKVRINVVYNGCGILVSQMQIGEMPDIYFACDTSFMDKVKDKFGEAKNVSNNQLMIVTRKGNPHGIKTLTDLAKPNVRVGIGHEHQCALGALTKETFIRTGTYAKILKNVVTQSPTGDFLVNQLFATGEKSLDVVVAYRSNILPYMDKVEGIPIPTKIDGQDIKCATPAQPIAIAKDSKYPELSKRLTEFLQSKESQQRFEKLGFGWEIKEVEK